MGNQRHITDGLKFEYMAQLLTEFFLSGSNEEEQLNKVLRDGEIQCGYKFKRLLGRGGFGSAIQVEDLQRQTTAVLKILHRQEGISTGITEYHMIKQLKNAPSIVNAYNLYYSPFGKFVVIALENLSQFESLKAYSQSHQSGSIEAIIVARNCADAVAELHALGIVHCDLSAKNILVHPRTLQVKVIDLGCSAKVGDFISAGGCIHFIDQGMQNAAKLPKLVDARVQIDLYALSLCCYLLLGDTQQCFIQSIQKGTEMTCSERELTLLRDSFVCYDTVKSLMIGIIDATTASHQFNRMMETKDIRLQQ